MNSSVSEDCNVTCEYIQGWETLVGRCVIPLCWSPCGHESPACPEPRMKLLYFNVLLLKHTFVGTLCLPLAQKLYYYSLLHQTGTLQTVSHRSLFKIIFNSFHAMFVLVCHCVRLCSEAEKRMGQNPALVIDLCWSLFSHLSFLFWLSVTLSPHLLWYQKNLTDYNGNFISIRCSYNEWNKICLIAI